ncbi:hypothetical protein, partial [Xanthomonas citri]|uniref:hypothetical protein n=1 Tax=Xanthomonas citri TaxID=346 RepID=UPI001A8DB258
SWLRDRANQDFFWVCLDDTAEPVVCAVELEGALADTLFRKKSNRAEPYYGAKFLDGFSQLVDWCSFGRSAAESSYKISSLFPDNSIPVYEYCLIAGLSSFAVDQSLKKRLNWWNQHIKLGNGTKTFTFDGLLAQGKKNT